MDSLTLLRIVQSGSIEAESITLKYFYSFFKTIMQFEYKKLTTITREDEQQLYDFLLHLDSEKKFFNLTMARIINLELLLVILEDNKIIGVSGFERKHLIPRGIIMIRKEYHNKGLGKQFMTKLLNEAKTDSYGFIMAVIEEMNTDAFKLHFSTGYCRCGKRGNLHYLVKPLNTQGAMVFNIFKILFPLLNFFDYLQSHMLFGTKICRAKLAMKSDIKNYASPKEIK